MTMPRTSASKTAASSWMWPHSRWGHKQWLRPRRERTIKPSVEELKFPKEGGTKTVEIESDGIGYTFEPIREAKINVDELHNLTITVGPLDGITAAWGTSIVLREDNVECSISISQADWY